MRTYVRDLGRPSRRTTQASTRRQEPHRRRTGSVRDHVHPPRAGPRAARAYRQGSPTSAWPSLGVSYPPGVTRVTQPMAQWSTTRSASPPTVGSWSVEAEQGGDHEREADTHLLMAVALSALAAVLAGSAQARIPEGNGTQPPSKTIATEQQAQLVTAGDSGGQRHTASVQDNRNRAAGPAVTGTFFFSFTPDPAIYVVYGAPISQERQAPQVSGTFTVDPKICANLDRAIRVAIQQCLSTLSRLPPRWSRRVRARRPSHTSSPPATAVFPRRRATPRGEDGAATAPSSRRQPLLGHAALRKNDIPIAARGPWGGSS